MKKKNSSILLYFFVFLLFAACSSDENKSRFEEKTPVKKNRKTAVKHKKRKKKALRTIKLNDKNAVSELTKYGKENPETIVLIKTNLGKLKVRLYKETPLHRANFIRLVKNNYFDDAMFYRVVKNFIVQTGNSDEPTHSNRRSKLGQYKIPAEFHPHLIHKKGALAMARSYKENPEKASSPYDFYIVHGRVIVEPELRFVKPELRRKLYGSVGGADHLDNEHTVFGEVIKGINLVDSIANQEVDESDWPRKDIVIKTIEIIR
ncbi:MAG: peptidylprolyl isomerase [Bacteroidia bacterium]|nr:MAG: peptidylprolyl isomerase [Bacteroidia bacterium]